MPLPTARRGVLTGLALTALAATALAGAPAAAAVPTAALRVVVTGPDGQVAPGVYVSVPGYGGRADAHGVFLTPATPGAAQQLCGILDPASPLGGAAGWARTCKPIDIGAGTTTRARLAMRPGAALSGRVTDARTGAPVSNAIVNPHDSDHGGFDRSARTDADGVYVVRNLTPGASARRLLVFDEPFDYAYPASAPWGWYGAALTPTLALRPGVTSGLDAVLTPAARLTGVVTDARGEAVADADVVIRSGNSVIAGTTTGANGRYLLFPRYDESGRVCASAAPDTGHPGGLVEKCRTGGFGRGLEIRLNFTLEERTS